MTLFITPPCTLFELLSDGTNVHINRQYLHVPTHEKMCPVLARRQFVKEVSSDKLQYHCSHLVVANVYIRSTSASVVCKNKVLILLSSSGIHPVRSFI